MMPWVLLAVGATALVAAIRTLNQLTLHRLDKSIDPAEFPDRRTFYRMNLLNAEGYSPEGQRVLRRWLLLMVVWFVTWFAALIMFVPA